MRKSVLVVAEHAETRESLAVLLRQEGLTVSLASGAADAVRVLRSTPIDIALVATHGTDIAAERLRARILHESPRCRVVPILRRVTLQDRKRVTRFGLGDYSLDEGVGLITATSVLKQAPHPYTAMLWHRWRISEDGQRANAEGGRTPAHPNVAPLERTRTERTYAVGTDELPNRAKIERQWKEVFQLR